MATLRWLFLAASTSALASLGIAGCKDDGGGATQQAADLVTGTPDERQIAGTLTRPVMLTAEALGGQVYCTVPAEDVTIAKFESGHYRIYLPGHHPCASAAPDSFRGWVPGDAVTFEDSAYAGELVRVEANPSVDVDMNYAGDHIFCTNGSCLIHEPLYGANRCYLHPKTKPLLDAAASLLQERMPGAKLHLFDCYRPIYVQSRMASLVPDPVFVAQPNPPNYGAHNGGLAIDLTIVDADGNLLDMGSGFDEFSDQAHFAAAGLTATQSANRKLLRNLMTSAGLSPYDGEWWHFSLGITAIPLDLAL
jgi:D-alanyl-D-alanine dipeptidase